MCFFYSSLFWSLFQVFKIKWLKAVEAIIVAMITGIVSFAMLTGINTCTDKQPYDNHAIVSKVNNHRYFSCPSPKVLVLIAYSKTCLKQLLKIHKTKVLMTNGSLMKVESISECSPSAILLTCI